MIFTHCGLSKEGLYVSKPNSMKNRVSLDFGYVLSVLSTDLNHQITFTCLLPNSSRMFSNSQCLVIGLPWKPCTVVFVRFIFCFLVGFFYFLIKLCLWIFILFCFLTQKDTKTRRPLSSADKCFRHDCKLDTILRPEQLQREGKHTPNLMSQRYFLKFLLQFKRSTNLFYLLKKQ